MRALSYQHECSSVVEFFFFLISDILIEIIHIYQAIYPRYDNSNA